jgi:uncharacterized protein (TIGR03437 family)
VALVIDPTLSYLTYLGGTKNDVARGIAVDGSGNAYVVGISNSVDLPVLSAYQSSMRGETANFVSGDAFIAKFNPSGALVYLTYLGGSKDDGATAVAVDSAGDAYVTGFTTSTDFPTLNAYQPSFGGLGGNGVARFGDAFIAKLNPKGTGLIYSTYLGGAKDDLAMAIAIDAAGDAYIAGSTQSSNFPTTPGVVQTSLRGSGGEPPVDCCNVPILDPGDAFVAKLSPSGSSLVFSTLLGGTEDDFASTLALDAAGNVYIAGFTLSNNFPTTSGAFQTKFGGIEAQNFFFNTGDGFISKLNPTGTQLVYSTYLGGAGDDWVSAIAVDSVGDIYFTGSSSTGSNNGAGLPTTAGVFQPSYAGYALLPFTGVNLLGDAIVGELNPAGSALIYLTYLGGVANDAGQAIALDSAGNAFVAGFTNSLNFPTVGGPVQSAWAGAGGNYVFLQFGDAFLAEVGPGGKKLLYSTYLGGTKDDMGLALALDGKGSVYLAGSTVSTDLKTTANAMQPKFGGTQYSRPSFFMGDAFYAIFSGFATGPAVNAVTNAASNAGGTVSPGMLFVAYGSNMGPATLAGAEVSDGRLSNNIAGAQMLFDGQPAPIVYVSANQFSGVVPYSVAGKSTTQVVASYQGLQSAPLTVQVASAVPGLFSVNFTGSGQAAAINQNGSVNSTANPAAAGSIVAVYGTGEGLLIPTPVDGTLSATPPTWNPEQAISVTVGGVPATIKYANTAPGEVAGLMQINFQLSSKTLSGNQPVAIKAGTIQSQANLTIAIK